MITIKRLVIKIR